MKLGIILENFHYPAKELGLVKGREDDLMKKDRS
jgi:hypothetical protein